MSTTLITASENYLKHLKKGGLKDRTLYTYGKDLEQIRRSFGDDSAMDHIQLLKVGKFLKSDELLKLANGKDRAEPTVKKTVRVFTHFILWSHKQGYMDILPLPKSLISTTTKENDKGD